MINKTGAKKLSSRNILGSKSKISGTLNLSENLQEKDTYMDSVVCKAATVSNIALDGSVMTIDDVVLATNDLILVKDQTDKTLNGVYYAAPTGFLRYDSIRTPTTASIELGTVNKELLYYQITSNYVIGSSEIIYLKLETSALPDGTINQILRHNGTDWVVADYTTLTDTSTSSKLAIVNGTSPTLKSAELSVTNDNSILLLQTDPSAPIGGQRIIAYTGTSAQEIQIQHDGNEFISIYSSTSSKYISMRGGTTGEGVVIEAKKNPSTTNKNIVVRNDSVDNFFVQNNGKIYSKEHPQIDTTEAASGKVLVCTDNDGNSQWQTISTGGDLPTGTVGQTLRYNSSNELEANSDIRNIANRIFLNKELVYNAYNPETELFDLETTLVSEISVNSDSNDGSVITISTYSNDENETNDAGLNIGSNSNGSEIIATAQTLELNSNILKVTDKSYTDNTNKFLKIKDNTGEIEFAEMSGDGHTHTNKDILDDITDQGDGNSFLADDGTYKEIDLKRGLVMQTADLNLTINPTNNIYYVLGFDALANKNYKFEYALNIRWYNNNSLANLFTFQIKIGEDVPTEICYGYGSILVNGQAASLLDQDNLNAYIDMTTTDAKWNILDNAGYIFKIEGILKMGSTNKTVTMKIITTGTEDVITIQPYLQTNSYLKWEMF